MSREVIEMRWIKCVVIGLFVLLTAAGADAQGTIEQVFDLHPGWNAVYLEVEPEDTSIEGAMAGLPVESVWTWRAGIRKSQFVQDPSQKLQQLDGWFGWFPPSRPESSLNNLFHFEVNRAYLIELGGAAPVTWRVTGAPALPVVRWESDSFNLVGFSVDPSSPPTLGEYFAPSPAHDGQEIYELGADGNWVRVVAPYSTTITPGAGYLVYCDGPSDYQGPLSVSTDGIDGLDFDAARTTINVTVANRLGVDTEVIFNRSAGAPVPLVLQVTDSVTNRTSWPDLPDGYGRDLGPGKSEVFNLGVRRADLPVDEAREILEISNGLGARLLLPVRVVGVHSAAKRGAKAAGAVASAGLWVGIARVNRVSQAQEAGTEPQPTGASFPVRFILHVDAGGQVRLLKEVLKVWQNGTEVEDPDNPGLNRTETPGHYVLLTDDSLADQFAGIQLRDGKPVGERVSAVAYDFEGDQLTVQGNVGLEGNLDVTIVVPPDLPTNPFFHRYHPDHDNLDAEFLNYKEEAYRVTRKIHWRFGADDPYGQDDPGWGDSVLGGIYTEELTGLHRNPIFIEGTFRMRRVSTVVTLNE